MREFEGRTSELIDLPFIPYRYALVVLGKNLGVGETHETIKSDNFHLSTDSRMNAIAAGMEWQPGLKIIFSTGVTTKGVDSKGREIYSEAREMADYMKKKFPHIPNEDIILEENSIDTAGNAEEVAKIVKDGD